MPQHDFPESDWKAFRKLHKLALERFCKRVLEEVERLCLDDSRSHHQRYVDVYRLMRRRDRELARAFDDPHRSAMITQVAVIHAHGLVEPEELARFSPRTRASIETLREELAR